MMSAGRCRTIFMIIKVSTVRRARKFLLKIAGGFIYRDGESKPVFPVGNDIYHEWWDATGDILWYIDKKGNYGGKGVCRVSYDYESRSFGEPELIWPNSLGHAESDSNLVIW